MSKFYILSRLRLHADKQETILENTVCADAMQKEKSAQTRIFEQKINFTNLPLKKRKRDFGSTLSGEQPLFKQQFQRR